MASPSDDPWLAPDKLQHFALSAAGTLAVYHALLLLRRRREDADGEAATATVATQQQERRRRTVALAIATAAAAALGLIKELGDGPLALWPGRASLRDGIADALGIVAAIAWVRARGDAMASGGDAGDDFGEGLPLVVRTLRPPQPPSMV